MVSVDADAKALAALICYFNWRKITLVVAAGDKNGGKYVGTAKVLVISVLCTRRSRSVQFICICTLVVAACDKNGGNYVGSAK
jgi:hypothetical protein